MPLGGLETRYCQYVRDERPFMMFCSRAEVGTQGRVDYLGIVMPGPEHLQKKRNFSKNATKLMYRYFATNWANQIRRKHYIGSNPAQFSNRPQENSKQGWAWKVYIADVAVIENHVDSFPRVTLLFLGRNYCPSLCRGCLSTLDVLTGTGR